MLVDMLGEAISSDQLKTGELFATWLSNETHYCIVVGKEAGGRGHYVVLSAADNSKISVPTRVQFTSNEVVFRLPAAIVRPRLDLALPRFTDPVKPGSLFIHDGSLFIACTNGMRLVVANLESGITDGPLFAGLPVTFPAWEIVVPVPHTGGHQVLFVCQPVS